MYRRICSGALALTVCVSLLFAQSPATAPVSPPVQVKRTPAAQTPTPKRDQVDPLIQKYDFGGQLRVLQDPTAMDPAKTLGPALPGGNSEIDGKVPESG